MSNKFQPYIGPSPFELKDEVLFFGREEETNELTSLVIAHKVVLIYAQSGAGKTSLVNAGLLPRLAKRGVQVLPITRVGSSLPANIKSDEIANIFVFNSLNSWANEKTDTTRLLQSSISDFLKGVPYLFSEERPRSPRLIVFDQMEELFFTYQERWTERTEFFEQVAKALEEDILLRVVFVIREDYLAQLDSYAVLLPEKVRTRFHLECLRKEAASEAVTRPLKKTYCSFAPGVAEQLVENLLQIQVQLPSGVATDITGEFVEPLQLQVVCQCLWHDLPSYVSIIEQDHLLEFGDVNNALSRFYERVLENAVQEAGVKESALRNWFEDVLIKEGKRFTVIRDLETTGGIPNTVVDIIEKSHIIREELKGGDRRYELSHDRLIRPIQDSNERWRNKHGEAEQTRKRLEIKAKDWVRYDRHEADLLNEVELLEAEHWLDSPEAAELGSTETLRVFVQASRAKVEGQRAEKERERAEAEYQRAEELRRLGERKDKIARILRQVIVGLIVISIVAVLASWFAISERNRANKEARASLSRELAAQSINSLTINSERSFLLALHAASVSYSIDKTVTTEAQNALRQAMEALRVEHTLSGHSGRVWDVAFSPDGWLMATASDDKTVKVWEAASGMELLTLSGHTGKVYSVAFSPNGMRLVSGSSDSTAKVWNVASGKELHTLQGHLGEVNGVAFSPNGKHLATASDDGTAIVWDVMSGKRLLTLTGHEDKITSVTFSPDGKLLATASNDWTAKVWDTTTGEELHSLSGHLLGVLGVAFSPDGRYLATCGFDYKARVWDIVSEESKYILRGHTDMVFGVAFSPDGQRLATSSFDRTTKVWDVASGNELFTLSDPNSRVYGVTFSPDGRYLAAACGDKTVKVWDVGSLNEFVGHRYAIHSLSLDFAGVKLATGSRDSTAKVWDSHLGNILLTLKGHREAVWGVAFSPNGKRLATGSLDRTAKVWDAVSGKEWRTLRGHTGEVYGVAFSPHGTRLATASADSTAKVWDIDSCKVLSTLRGHNDVVWNVAFSPDGRRLATTSSDSTAKVWDLDTGNVLFTLYGHTDAVFGIAFSPDGKCLATASADATAKIWDVNSGKELRTLSGHDSPLENIAFSRDGTCLATTSYDKTAKVWEVISGNELCTLYGHTNRVYGVAFSPDGKQLFTAGWDGVVLAHILNVDDLMARAWMRVTRSLTSEECRMYLHEESCSPTVVAMGLIAEGNNFAKAGHVDSAIVEFEKALKTDPILKLDPRAEVKRLAPKGLIAKGEWLVRQGKVKEANTAFEKAQNLDPIFKIPASSWNNLCWFGSLWGYPADVLYAGEKAVALDSSDGRIRDSRGVARALTGDYKGAIEDFQAFKEWIGTEDDPRINELKAKRQLWIKELKAGKNPLTPEEIKKLFEERTLFRCE